MLILLRLLAVHVAQEGLEVLLDPQSPALAAASQNGEHTLDPLNVARVLAQFLSNQGQPASFLHGFPLRFPAVFRLTSPNM